MNRTRSAPAIGRRVVVRFAPIPEDIRAERAAYLRRIITRSRPAPTATDAVLACPS